MIPTFNAQLIHKQKLTPDVLLLSFQAPLDFFFKAGQFVSLILRNGTIQKPRSYSILNPPSQQGKLDLCVKIITGGFASEIFKQLEIGDELTVKGPFGNFIFDDKTDHEHWFIGTGTGIAPLYSMIKKHLPQYPLKRFNLIVGYRTSEDLLFHEELLDLKASYPNLEYVPTLSRSSWNGKHGHVQDHLGNDFENKTFYICGLKELVLDMQKLLLSKGVKPANIKFERYT